jgi:hypothetical protein
VHNLELEKADQLQMKRWPCDKTQPLSHLLYPATKMLMLRPPRFQTSRLFEQLDLYFSGDRDGFAGSWLAHKRKPLLRERPAPVVSMNLANLFDPLCTTTDPVAMVQTGIQEQLERAATRHNLTPSKELTLGELLSSVEENTQCRAVLLLDNYDAPIVEASVEHRHAMEDLVGSLVHQACFQPPLADESGDTLQQHATNNNPDIPAMRRQLLSFYRKYNPEKLHGPHGLRFADMVLRHFDFEVADLNAALHKEYNVDLHNIQPHRGSDAGEKVEAEAPLSNRPLHYMLVAGCFRHRHPLLMQCLPPENVQMRDITHDLQFNSLVGLTKDEVEIVLDTEDAEGTNAVQAISGGYWWGGVSQVQGNNVEYVHHPLGVEALSAASTSSTTLQAAAAVAAATAPSSDAATADLVRWGEWISAPASAALPWQQFWANGVGGTGASSVIRSLTVLQDMGGTFVGASIRLPGAEADSAYTADQWPILLLQAGVLTMGERAVWIHEFQTSSQVRLRFPNEPMRQLFLYRSTLPLVEAGAWSSSKGGEEVLNQEAVRIVAQVCEQLQALQLLLSPASSISSASTDTSDDLLALQSLDTLLGLARTLVVEASAAADIGEAAEEEAVVRVLELWLACTAHEHLGDLDHLEANVDTFTPISKDWTAAPSSVQAGAKKRGANPTPPRAHPLGYSEWWVHATENVPALKGLDVDRGGQTEGSLLQLTFSDAHGKEAGFMLQSGSEVGALAAWARIGPLL